MIYQIIQEQQQIAKCKHQGFTYVCLDGGNLDLTFMSTMFKEVNGQNIPITGVTSKSVGLCPREYMISITTDSDGEAYPNTILDSMGNKFIKAHEIRQLTGTPGSTTYGRNMGKLL